MGGTKSDIKVWFLSKQRLNLNPLPHSPAVSSWASFCKMETVTAYGILRGLHGTMHLYLFSAASLTLITSPGIL